MSSMVKTVWRRVMRAASVWHSNSSSVCARRHCLRDCHRTRLSARQFSVICEFWSVCLLLLLLLLLLLCLYYYCPQSRWHADISQRMVWWRFVCLSVVYVAWFSGRPVGVSSRLFNAPSSSATSSAGRLGKTTPRGTTASHGGINWPLRRRRREARRRQTLLLPRRQLLVISTSEHRPLRLHSLATCRS